MTGRMSRFRHRSLTRALARALVCGCRAAGVAEVTLPLAELFLLEANAGFLPLSFSSFSLASDFQLNRDISSALTDFVRVSRNIGHESS